MTEAAFAVEELRGLSVRETGGAKEEAFPVREWAPEGLQLGEEGGVTGIWRGFHGLARSLAGFNQMGL